MPQLRTLDGTEIISEEKVKAENLHGLDMQDREIIFKSLLPEEKFVDRRIARIEDVPAENDLDMGPMSPGGERETQSQAGMSSVNSASVNAHLARQYVGELISRVDFGEKNNDSPRFVHGD